MTWLLLAIVSYFLTAVVVVIDKFLLSHKTRSPLVYTFYVGVLQSFSFLLWPFDFSFLSVKITLVALGAGMSFFFAVFFLYSAVRKREISRVVPIIGGFSPIFILILSYFFLGERLPVFWLVSLGVLILGSFLLSFEKNGPLPLYSFVAAIFFALTFFGTKVVFLESSFLNGFIWTRVGTLIPAFVVLFSSSFRLDVIRSPLRASRPMSLFFLCNKALGASAFLILNYAIMLGSVTVINALQGVQYAFLFIIALIFSFFRPQFLSESFSSKTIIQKILGITLVSAGVALLFLT